MSRIKTDAVIVGGGVVGAACALMLAKHGVDVTLVEARQPPQWSEQHPDLRVFAFAPDNAQLFQELNVWQSILQARAQPYQHMRVWDAGGPGELHFNGDHFARPALGWIIENNVLIDRLWKALAHAGVHTLTNAAVEHCEQRDEGVVLQLSGGTRIDAKLVIAADGAESKLRESAGIAVTRHDYHQRGIVAYIETELPHQNTAWQRFLPSGPLAVLPFSNGRSSIVWTLPEEEAHQMLSVEDAAFSDALTNAFAGRLGAMNVVSKRAAFPLRRQLAETLYSKRMLLIGDAAHVVHPLAGQGVNIGLRDVADLHATIKKAKRLQRDWMQLTSLQRWARQRKSENAVAAYTFDVINRMYSNDSLPATLVRGPLLGIAGKLPALTDVLWKRAAGL